MHPQVRQPSKGQCPLCGMDLIPLAKGKNELIQQNTVVLSERAKKLAKIETTRVRRRYHHASSLQLLGYIELDEASLKNITAWTAGRIDRLHVRTRGEKIRKGQIIASLYSPEILEAHQDLIIAKGKVEQMNQKQSRVIAVKALEIAKQRLQLLGIPLDEIREMEMNTKPMTQIDIRSPFRGTIMKRVATEGAYVKTGALLYTIADLSTLWIQLDAYESDLSSIELGREVSVKVEGIDDETFHGKVEFIDPILDEKLRTAKIRVEIQNNSGRLKPGMFARAGIIPSMDKKPPLVIPATAPLFTGLRSVVFVEVPDVDKPTYQARTVRLGPKTGSEYPVVSGLKLGERVVMKGAFMLDADLQIQGGESMMTDMGRKEATSNSTTRLTSDEKEQFKHMMIAYLAIQQSLADDNLKRVQEVADALLHSHQVPKSSYAQQPNHVWSMQKTHIKTQGSHLKHAKNLEDARGTFELLSKTMIMFVQQAGNPLGKPLYVAFCPMAMGSNGAQWLQDKKIIDNSYFGPRMRTCGEIRKVLQPGAYLSLEK